MSSSLTHTQSLIARSLQPFGETIFTEISRLAVQHNAVNLGQGFPNFEGPRFIKNAAIEAINKGHDQYARMYGIPDLNRAIAEKFTKATGVNVDSEREITVTSGCTEAIAASLLGLVNPGDEVILIEPYYDSYRACVAMTGAVARFVTLRPPHFELLESELRAAFSAKTKAILINTPHNPTGKVYSRAELEMIARLSREHEVIVLSDEVYEHLVFDGEHISIATLPGMWERTITLSSLGKTFSLTGWKIGWAIAPPHLTAAVRAAHQFLTFATATPLQHGAIAALRAPQTYFNDFLADYRSKRDLLVNGLHKLGFTVFPPKGTYFVIVDHTPFGFESDAAFCRHLIEHIGVAAIPTSVFYHNPEDGRSLVRFAFCKTEETLCEGLRRMQSLKSR
jgi:L-glutamine---4-(methylsulfanyl)-2-oxobutanoate aminotransferase